MFLKFLLALIPIIWLIVAMSVIKLPGYRACYIALIIAALEACFIWKLSPPCVATAALQGILNALWPICLVIVAALFTYNLTLETGAMEDIKRMLGGVSTDSRILMLIIAWGFGNFMEGMAGFGTAVAIPAGMLVGIGFDPIQSVVACLIINSTPTVFGSVGVPATTMASITGLDILQFSAYASLIQIVLTFLSPFLAVMIIGGGVTALRGLFPFTLIASLSFCIPQVLCSVFIGAELPNILGAVISMGVMVAAARLIPHKKIPEYEVKQTASNTPMTVQSGFVAWAPFIFTFIFLLVTSNLCKPVHDLLAAAKTTIQVYAGENPESLTFYWINTPGIIIFFAAFCGGLVQKASPARMFKVLKKTFLANIKVFITVCSVLAVAKIMGYSGMISDIAVVLVAVTGSFFPLFSPLIGVIGGFVTGSGTSTAVLFGKLQQDTAAAISDNPNLPAWLCAANEMGGGVGKMICPQSIAIGCAAVGLTGSESKILGKVFIYVLLYAVIGGLICFFVPVLGLI